MIQENLKNYNSKVEKIVLPAQWEGGARATLFSSGEFLKFETPSPKPARIPPQTPPAGGKSAEAGRIHIPSQMFRPAESALVLFEKSSRKVYNYSTTRVLPFSKADYR